MSEDKMNLFEEKLYQAYGKYIYSRKQYEEEMNTTYVFEQRIA